MPVLTQLNLNIGTEQNPNMVLHDLHDIRISSTDVTTVTRLLGCDAGVNSIAPLTLANAASLLGGVPYVETVSNNNISQYTSLNDFTQGVYFINLSTAPSFLPNRRGYLKKISGVIDFYSTDGSSITGVYHTISVNSTWTPWKPE